MRIFFFAFILFISTSCIAKKKSEQYFLLNNGVKENFKKFIGISNDTVYFQNTSSGQFVLIDSIKSIYVYSPSHVIGGSIAGLIGGVIVATLVGVSVYRHSEFGPIGTIEIGAVVGTILGATEGYDGEDINYNLSDCNRAEREKILPGLLIAK